MITLEMPLINDGFTPAAGGFCDGSDSGARGSGCRSACTCCEDKRNSCGLVTVICGGAGTGTPPLTPPMDPLRTAALALRNPDAARGELCALAPPPPLSALLGARLLAVLPSNC